MVDAKKAERRSILAPSSAPAARRLDIQGLRGIAVLAVVAYHAGAPVTGGFLGVDVFFVISGFVITGLLLREWDSERRINLPRFYFLRFRRLAPPLLAMLVPILIATVFLLSPSGSQQIAFQTALGATFFSGNFVLQRVTGDYFDLSADLNPFLHTWSLAVEEQTYLVVPVVLMAALVIARRPRFTWIPLAVFVVLGLVAFAYTVIPGVGQLLPQRLGGFYGPVPRFWAFAVGAAIALAPRWRTSATAAAALGFAGLLALGLSFSLLSADAGLPGPWTLLPVLGAGAVIVSGRNDGNPVARLLSVRPLTAVGDISYAWYLWHWPLIVFAGILVPSDVWLRLIAILCSLLAAVASTQWIETPLRRWNPPSPWAKVRFVLATTVPVAGIALTLLLVSSNHYWLPKVESFDDAILVTHLDQPAGCAGDGLGGSRECRWNQGDGAPIYLIGDSNAGHLIEPFLDTATELDRPLITSITSGCPPIPVRVVRPTMSASWNEHCAAAADGILSSLSSSPPGLVVLSMTSSYWNGSETQVEIDGKESTEVADQLRVLEAGLRSFTRQALASGHAVLLIVPVPQFGWDPQKCSILQIVGDDCGGAVPISHLPPHQSSVWRVVEAVAADEGASTLSFQDVLCPKDVCSAISSDGTVMYRDSAHLSVGGARTLAPEVMAAVLAARPTS